MFTKLWKRLGKRLIEKNRYTRKDNIKRYLKEAVCNDVDCSKLSRNRVECWVLCFLKCVFNYAVSC
jgi:hypothetical protein